MATGIALNLLLSNIPYNVLATDSLSNLTMDSIKNKTISNISDDFDEGIVVGDVSMEDYLNYVDRNNYGINTYVSDKHVSTNTSNMNEFSDILVSNDKYICLSNKNSNIQDSNPQLNIPTHHTDIVLYDKNLNYLETASNFENINLTKILPLEDGGYISIGYITISSSTKRGVILKLKEDFSIEKQLTYGNNNYSDFSDMIYSNGYFYLLGKTTSSNVSGMYLKGLTDILCYKIDTNFNIINKTLIGTSKNDEVEGIFDIENDELTFLAQCNSNYTSLSKYTLNPDLTIKSQIDIDSDRGDTTHTYKLDDKYIIFISDSYYEHLNIYILDSDFKIIDKKYHDIYINNILEFNNDFYAVTSIREKAIIKFDKDFNIIDYGSLLDEDLLHGSLPLYKVIVDDDKLVAIGQCDELTITGVISNRYDSFFHSVKERNSLITKFDMDLNIIGDRPILKGYSEGDGSKENPYILNNINDLNLLRKHSELRVIGVDSYFSLNSNINLKNTEFEPIPFFEGHLNGNGHTIKNFTYNDSTMYGIGLFRSINHGEITNLHMENVDLTAKSITGGIVGRICSGAIIKDCSVSGKINANSCVGGIVGGIYNRMNDHIGNTKIALIKNCSSNVSIVGQNLLGGITGYASDTLIENNTSASIISTNRSKRDYCSGIGGIVGQLCREFDEEENNIRVNNCIFNGSITAFNNYYSSFGIGGIAGESYNNYDISNCTSSGIIDSDEYVGGIVGVNNRNTISDCESNMSINASEYIGGIIGYSYGDTIYTNLVSNTNVLSDGGTIGGLIGLLEDNSYLSESSFEGDISPMKNSNYISNIGGLIGIIDGSDIKIEKSYANISINSALNASGIVSKLSDNVTISDIYVIGNIKGFSGLAGITNSLPSNFNNININNVYSATTINSYYFDKASPCIYTVDNSNSTLPNTNNLYYDSDLYNTNIDKYATPLTTLQMQGANAKDNMLFDYDAIWKLNKEYYPTFKQINTAPVLVGEDIKLILNQNYNLLDYVTVEDFEDKGLIPEVTTDLDITKMGDYTAIFTVTDSKGLSNTLTLNIKVVMENPIINANDIEIFVNDEFKERNGVTATDVDGTDITEYIKVIENTVNTKVPDVYKVVYEIKSLYKSPIQKEIKVTVKEKPVINNENDKDDNVTNTDKDNSKPSNSDNNKNNTNKPQTGDIVLASVFGVLFSALVLYFINRKNNK